MAFAFTKFSNRQIVIEVYDVFMSYACYMIYVLNTVYNLILLDSPSEKEVNHQICSIHLTNIIVLLFHFNLFSLVIFFYDSDFSIAF